MNWTRQPRPAHRGWHLSVVVTVLAASVVLVASSSSAQYQVRQPTTPARQQASISISEPAGNTTWEKGQRYTIKWTSKGRIPSVKIVLIDQAKKSHDVVQSATNSGSYNYTVSTRLADGPYKVVVMTADGSVRGEAGGTVTIQKKTFGTVSPKPVTGGPTPKTSIQSLGKTTGQITAAGEQDERLSSLPAGAGGTAQAELPEVDVAQAADDDSAVVQYDGTQLVDAASAEELRQHQQESDVTGFIFPDFQVVNLRYLQPQELLVAHLSNNGVPYQGPVDARVIALASLEGSGYTFDNTVTWHVDLGPGELDTVPVTGFRWPESIDYPQLTFGLNVDPQNVLTELNETNNSFERTLRVFCEARIDRADDNWVYEGERIWLHGWFGQEQGNKVVRMEKGATTCRPEVVVWENTRVSIKIPNFQESGTYDVRVYCSDPIDGEAYTSNAIRLTVKQQNKDMDIRKLADALADEFGDEIDFDNRCRPPEIVSQQVQRIASGRDVEVRCRYMSTCPRFIYHEVWQDDQRIKIWQNTDQSNAGGERESSHQFFSLEPGDYEYVCRVIDTEGRADTASTSFIQ